MQNKLIALILTVMTTAISYGQPRIVPNLERSIEIGVNHSFLTYNIKGLDKRYTIEYRIGGIIRAPLNKKFGFNAGLRVGYKPRANIYYSGQPPYDNPLYLASLDKTLSQSNHFFAEIPIIFDYRIKRFQIGLGSLVRHYMNIGGEDGLDVIKNRYETGLQTRCNFYLVDNLSIGIEGYFGISSLVSVGYSDPLTNNVIAFKAKNNFIGLNLMYKLSQKR